MLLPRSDNRTLIAVLVCALALSLTAVVMAESDIARTASGKPDLSGTYNAATLTPLTRPPEFGDNLYLSEEEANELAEAERLRTEERSLASDPNREAPPEGGDGSPGASGNVGGYNTFWIDRGTDAFLVDGKFRTSIIIDPKNGQMPPMLPAAQKEMAARFAGFGRENDGTAYWLEKGNDAAGPYDNMEQRNLAERCVIGFTGTTPSFPSLYNNYKRIVQTDDHIMILIEMVHDARIVRMKSEGRRVEHPPAGVTKWLGDSIGWWEGDELVVDTTNLDTRSSFRGGSEKMHVVERFIPQEDGSLLYRFTVEDPLTWTAPWTGEYVWQASDQKVYEYACHEGNYALGNIMRGARLLEADALAAK